MGLWQRQGSAKLDESCGSAPGPAVLTSGRGFRLPSSQETSSPPQLGPFQGHLDIHVLTAIVRDDDVEVWVTGGLEQLFHVCDELLHPARLVLHYPRGAAGRKKQR